MSHDTGMIIFLYNFYLFESILIVKTFKGLLNGVGLEQVTLFKHFYVMYRIFFF